MKKLNSEEAFDQLMRHGKNSHIRKEEKQDLEDGFGQQGVEKKGIGKWVVRLALFLGLMVVMGGVVVFYWFVVMEAKPESVTKVSQPKAPIFIAEHQAKQMIRKNLESFLSAESNEERNRYVYAPDEERSSMDVYYSKRGWRDTPLWKVEFMERHVSAMGEIRFVVYQDIKKRRRTVSFQRVGDDYKLHWSAMKAFCEMPWEQFVVERPKEPVLMRAYLRRYNGVWPPGISRDHYQCFLIEDRGGLFSEIAVMKKTSFGFLELKRLPSSARHPVTLRLVYHIPKEQDGHAERVLTIDALVHLRWQQMALDPRVLRK